MITAKVRRPFQRADKRSQVPRKPGNLIRLPVCILRPVIADHDQSLSSRPSGAGNDSRRGEATAEQPRYLAGYLNVPPVSSLAKRQP